MEETYLPAFKKLVKEAKVESVMGAYNRTNGEPCCASKDLMGRLRGDWGFEGHFVSDCWAIKDFHEGHHVTDTPVESVALAMNNGCDLNCGNLFHYLKQAVEEGLVDESRLDEALVNLFTTRMKLGVFDEKGKNPFDEIDYTAVDTKAMQDLNRKVAEKCVVLLKNENQTLPLDKKNLKTVGVIGPNANNRRALVGNYEGTASRYWTVLEGIQEYLGDDVRVMASEGCHLCHKKSQGLGQEDDRISEVKGVCEASDVIIAVMGLDSGLEGEEGDQGNEYASGDKPNLELPGLQQHVLETICSFGKPVVLVLLSGSALAVNWADQNVPAIIQGWYPGAQGGRAIADILFGEKNPEGKLPVTFYKSTDDLPEFPDYAMKGRTYRYMQYDALYPFGYGLSYTDFEYSNVSVTKDGDGAVVKATVKNAGKLAGGETVQVYVKVCKENTPNAQLKGIKKLHLQPGESANVEIKLSREALGAFDENGELQVGGTVKIYVGGQAPDQRSAALTGKKTAEFELNI